MGRPHGRPPFGLGSCFARQGPPAQARSRKGRPGPTFGRPGPACYDEPMHRQEPITTAEYTYAAVFEPAEEGGFVVSFPAFPGLMTQGETLDEARAMAVELLKGY